MSLLIKPNEEPVVVEVKSFKDLQDLVSGYVEVVNLSNDLFKLIVNEDGKLLNLPPNKTASKIAIIHEIVGNAVLMFTEEFKALK